MSGSAIPVLLMLLSLLIGFSVPIQQPWVPSEDVVTLVAEERTEIPMPRGVRN